MFVIPKVYQYFLFDMDGTLVNTEPVGPEVFEALFHDHDVVLSEDEKRLFLKVWRRDGTDINQDDYLAELVTRHDIHISPEAIIQEFYQRYQKAIVHAAAMPGVSTFLRRAKETGRRLALVTSSKRAQAAAILEHHAWDAYFDLIVSEEDVTKFKPDPEPYLIALDKFAANPQATMIFEDAKNGVVAGKATDSFVIGIRAGNDNAQDLSDADQVVSTFDDITCDM